MTLRRPGGRWFGAALSALVMGMFIAMPAMAAKPAKPAK